MIVPMSEAVQTKEIAFYYPGPMWHSDDWTKTMILFFDGIGILLPDYLKGSRSAKTRPLRFRWRSHGCLVRRRCCRARSESV
jgi:hypothetical protein